jgi:uncharacterized protein (TIGR03435 family)
MRNKLFPTLSAFLAVAAIAFGQETKPESPAPALAFEVASIKPAPPMDPSKIMAGQAHIGMKVDSARVDIGFLSLADLIRIAYKLKSYQLTGPDWMGAQRFDILAKMPPGAKEDQVPQMLQVLLSERFKLAFHRETKEQNVYALTVAKSGLKMQEADPDPEPPKKEDKDKEPLPPGAEPPPPPNQGNPQVKVSGSGENQTITFKGGGNAGGAKVSVTPNGMHMEMEKMPMDGLVEFLSRMVDRPIVDETGLKAKYKVALDMSMAEMMAMARKAGAPVPAMAPGGSGPADAASDPGGGSAFTAVAQLGLKLETKKTALEYMIVDKLQKDPSEN